MTLTIHHLHISQSERVVWLCEELNIPYELKNYNRSPLTAPPEYKALHPQGTAPIIQDGELTLAESGACIEYICHKHANGNLFLPATHPAYSDFLYWWHWGNGSLMPTMMQRMALQALDVGGEHFLAGISEKRFEGALRALDDRLAGNEWLAGVFSVADVMVVFALTTLRYFLPFGLGGYSNILAYLDRVGQREAYRRAMEKCEPGLVLALGAVPPKGIMG
ncbi:putative glutathione S-transferase [Aspergillus avenaceus]|uniref:Putative glutathione S-transferase n=1 Tax=Aspergillus avenaceus TaxID=36643 RepID=A0A5N6TKG1_ASPAV|nr:putative glutathione S-transferase [Aspergillus avenaceus]